MAELFSMAKISSIARPSGPLPGMFIGDGSCCLPSPTGDPSPIPGIFGTPSLGLPSKNLAKRLPLIPAIGPSADVGSLKPGLLFAGTRIG